jgi:hypothetical protein
MANRVIDDRIVVANTVTKLGIECEGRVVLGASHGGVYAAYLTVKAKARGVILNDAGRAKDDSGISGGPYCQDLGIPYATTDTMSCRIGDGESAVDEGVISFANPLALSLGVTLGMSAIDAALFMTKAALTHKPAPSYAEARKELSGNPRERMIVLMDSISLVNDQDGGRIIVSGSHGAMPGADPAMAIRGDAFAGIFHDAGGGKDDAATSRLPALDQRGIIAGTVACMSARIGDGESIYRDGVLSYVNKTAKAAGGVVGMPAKTFIDSLVTK